VVVVAVGVVVAVVVDVNDRKEQFRNYLHG
jgi:hypothetical protein